MLHPVKSTVWLKAAYYLLSAAKLLAYIVFGVAVPSAAQELGIMDIASA